MATSAAEARIASEPITYAAIRSSPTAHRPTEEESQQPASEQADPKDHGEEGHDSPAHGLEESRRHEVVGNDQQHMMDQHADSMSGSTMPRAATGFGANSAKPTNFVLPCPPGQSTT